MSGRPLTDEQVAETVAAYNAAGKNITHAAVALGIKRQSMQDRLKTCAERGALGYKAVLPGYRVAQVTNTPNGDFVQQKPERGDVFTVPEGQVVKGISALVDEDGREIIKWIKTRTDDGASVLFDQIKTALEGAKTYTSLPPAPPVVNERLMAFYPIADVHLGAFAWRAETGNDYDLKIAERILKECTGELIARSAPAETAVICDIGDFFHGDNTSNQTSRSKNPLDIDSRHPKVVQTGFMAVVWLIEMALQKHQRVIYRKLAGNHDEETSPTFALGIWAYFRDNPRVEVDISPCRMFVHRHGKTLLAVTHGDMLKMADLAGWLAASHAKDWGETEHRYGWTGHIHNKTAFTAPGMTTESLNSPAARDAWHAANGYHAPRNMISVTYDLDGGERDRLTVAVKP